MDDIVKDFLVESNENLDRLDQELVKLESDPSSRELLSSIFRTIHTIKGSCGFLGFAKLEKVAHAGENLLSRLRDGKLLLNAEITSGLLAMVDAVRHMLAQIQATERDGEEDYADLLEQLKHLQQPGMERESGLAPVPALSPEPTPPAGTVQEAASPQASDLTSIPTAATVAETAPAQSLRNQVTTPSQHRTTAEAVPETIRVGVNLLDKLMNLVGELVLARNQLLQFSNNVGDTGFQAISQRMNLIATELQEEVMKTRMQPIGNIWSKFPRTVRDLALGCGKEVRIEMEGKETELDKTIIEAIKDPLTHLVRNAVDHGIELPEDRKNAGKDPSGRLVLRAFHEGGQVNIEITDDGAGLNGERIRKKAIERGLITADQSARMQDRDVFNLIFLPGFSTAEKVTNVSGRGVGMDVVRTNVEKIGGTVDVQSTAGQGTTVRVKIPLTLAIIPALVVTCGSDRYAIPQVNLLELVRLEGEQARKGIELIHGAPVYRLRGQLLPLVYLVRELKAATPAEGDSQSGAQRAELLDFSLARDRHQRWLDRLRELLDGKLTMTVEQAGSHKDCVLGKWLYGTGLTEYGDITEMSALEKTHQHFHQLVRDVVAAKVSGNPTRAEQLLAEVGPMSKEIFELLTSVERKALEFQNVNIVVLCADDRQFGLVVNGIHDTEEIVVKPLSKQLKGVNVFAGATIMGDGRAALILDVLGLAQRARVITEIKDHALSESAVNSEAAVVEKQRFLLFAGPDESRMAVPLDTVARLEELPLDKVEKAGMQWVAQYRGKILPLVNLAYALDERRRRRRHKKFTAGSGEGALQVLVCNNGGQAVGLVVERILDIVEDAAEVRYPASRPGVLYSAVINGQVTELLDVPVVLAAGANLDSQSEPVGVTQ